MKKISFIGMMLISISVFAQKIDASKVPLSVKENFAKQFPNIQTVKWEIEKSNYEANFKQGATQKSALYNAKGDMLEDETTIGINELPKEVTAYVNNKYNNAKIKEAARIKLPTGEIHYEAEVNGKDLLFDEKGNFLKKD